MTKPPKSHDHPAIKDPDQSEHVHSQQSRLYILWVAKDPNLEADSEDCSKWAQAKADLNLL